MASSSCTPSSHRQGEDCSRHKTALDANPRIGLGRRPPRLALPDRSPAKATRASSRESRLLQRTQNARRTIKDATHREIRLDGHDQVAYPSPWWAIGAVHVFYGPLPAGFVRDLNSGGADLTVIGRYDDDFAMASVGYTFAAGDVSGDCVDDLLFGIATGPMSRRFAGEVNAVFSPPAPPRSPCSARSANSRPRS